MKNKNYKNNRYIPFLMFILVLFRYSKKYYSDIISIVPLKWYIISSIGGIVYVYDSKTDLVLRGLTIDQKPLKDHMEAVGHKDAFDFVNELVKDNVLISESIIKQIHYLVLADKKEDRGVYRRVPVRIMGAQHEPVQPYLIELPITTHLMSIM